MSQNTIVVTIPTDLPQPHYQLSQRVRCTNLRRFPGVFGVIRGFDYMDTARALVQGLDDSHGWTYTVRLDDNDPRFWLHPVVQIDEEDLELLELPELS